jgi:hypothetical protein
LSSISIPASAGDAAIQLFLNRLNVALSRRRTYGGNHPMVLGTETEALAALDAALDSRSSFTIGVAKSTLMLNGQLVGGVTNTTKELAGRLHRRGVGALTFHSGADLAGLQAMLGWLALDPAKDTGPDENAIEPPTISGIIIGRMAYDALMLDNADQAADLSLMTLWQALASIAADGTGRQYGFGTSRNADVAAASGDEEKAFDVMFKEEEHVTDIAQALKELVSQPEFARRTAVALMHLAAQGAQAPAELRARIGERLHAVIDRLGDSSFAPIIRGLGQRAEQQEFVLQVVDVLPVLAVSNWLQVASRASEQELSHHLLRLMTKLSQHAANHRQGLTDANFRGAAKELVEGWVLSDPNPEEHVRLLDRIALRYEATTKQLGRTPEQDAAGLTENARVVQMALEIDVIGDDALAAADEVVATGGLIELLSWLDSVPASDGSRLLRTRVTSPDALRKLLHANPVDEPAAAMLLQSVDMSHADLLLDSLAKAESRVARDLIRDRLRRFGEPLRPVLLARLDGATWFFARNLLGLIHDLLSVQQGTNDVGAMMKYMDHENPQVRVEAARMLLSIDAVREAVVRRGLLDADERVAEVVLHFVNHYLHAPHDGRKHTLSVGAAGHLMKYVDDAKHSDAMRVIAIRAVAATGYNGVRDWLLERVIKRTRFLRRATLAKPSLLTATALNSLQAHYAEDPAVREALDLGKTVKGDANWRVPTPYLGSPVIR